MRGSWGEGTLPTRPGSTPRADLGGLSSNPRGPSPPTRANPLLRAQPSLYTSTTAIPAAPARMRAPAPRRRHSFVDPSRVAAADPSTASSREFPFPSSQSSHTHRHPHPHDPFARPSSTPRADLAPSAAQLVAAERRATFSAASANLIPPAAGPRTAAMNQFPIPNPFPGSQHSHHATSNAWDDLGPDAGIEPDPVPDFARRSTGALGERRPRQFSVVDPPTFQRRSFPGPGANSGGGLYPHDFAFEHEHGEEEEEEEEEDAVLEKFSEPDGLLSSERAQRFETMSSNPLVRASASGGGTLGARTGTTGLGLGLGLGLGYGDTMGAVGTSLDAYDDDSPYQTPSDLSEAAEESDGVPPLEPDRGDVRSGVGTVAFTAAGVDRWSSSMEGLPTSENHDGDEVHGGIGGGFGALRELEALGHVQQHLTHGDTHDSSGAGTAGGRSGGGRIPASMAEMESEEDLEGDLGVDLARQMQGLPGSRIGPQIFREDPGPASTLATTTTSSTRELSPARDVYARGPNDPSFSDSIADGSEEYLYSDVGGGSSTQGDGGRGRDLVDSDADSDLVRGLGLPRRLRPRESDSGGSDQTPVLWGNDLLRHRRRVSSSSSRSHSQSRSPSRSQSQSSLRPVSARRAGEGRASGRTGEPWPGAWSRDQSQADASSVRSSVDLDGHGTHRERDTITNAPPPRPATSRPDLPSHHGKSLGVGVTPVGAPSGRAREYVGASTHLLNLEASEPLSENRPSTVSDDDDDHRVGGNVSHFSASGIDLSSDPRSYAPSSPTASMPTSPASPLSYHHRSPPPASRRTLHSPSPPPSSSSPPASVVPSSRASSTTRERSASFDRVPSMRATSVSPTRSQPSRSISPSSRPPRPPPRSPVPVTPEQQAAALETEELWAMMGDRVLIQSDQGLQRATPEPFGAKRKKSKSSKTTTNTKNRGDLRTRSRSLSPAPSDSDAEAASVSSSTRRVAEAETEALWNMLGAGVIIEGRRDGESPETIVSLSPSSGDSPSADSTNPPTRPRPPKLDKSDASIRSTPAPVPGRRRTRSREVSPAPSTETSLASVGRDRRDHRGSGGYHKGPSKKKERARDRRDNHDRGDGHGMAGGYRRATYRDASEDSSSDHLPSPPPLSPRLREAKEKAWSDRQQFMAGRRWRDPFSGVAHREVAVQIGGANDRGTQVDHDETYGVLWDATALPEKHLALMKKPARFYAQLGEVDMASGRGGSRDPTGLRYEDALARAGVETRSAGVGAGSNPTPGVPDVTGMIPGMGMMPGAPWGAWTWAGAWPGGRGYPGVGEGMSHAPMPMITPFPIATSIPSTTATTTTTTTVAAGATSTAPAAPPPPSHIPRPMSDLHPPTAPSTPQQPPPATSYPVEGSDVDIAEDIVVAGNSSIFIEESESVLSEVQDEDAAELETPPHPTRTGAGGSSLMFRRGTHGAQAVSARNHTTNHRHSHHNMSTSVLSVASQLTAGRSTAYSEDFEEFESEDLPATTSTQPNPPTLTGQRGGGGGGGGVSGPDGPGDGRSTTNVSTTYATAGAQAPPPLPPRVGSRSSGAVAETESGRAAPPESKPTTGPQHPQAFHPVSPPQPQVQMMFIPYPVMPSPPPTSEDVGSWYFENVKRTTSHVRSSPATRPTTATGRPFDSSGGPARPLAGVTGRILTEQSITEGIHRIREKLARMWVDSPAAPAPTGPSPAPVTGGFLYTSLEDTLKYIRSTLPHPEMPL